MAFVILSAGTLTQSKVRTISARAFLAGASIAVLAALGGGFALGYGFQSPANSAASQEGAADPSASPEARLLIGRFGELAGRMVQLEAEAKGLANRIGVLRDFESRLSESADAESKSGRIAKTPPASSGGPLLDPSAAFVPRVTDPVTALLRSPLMSDSDGAGKLSDELERMERDIERVSETFAHLDGLATSFSLAQMAFPGRAPVPDVEVNSNFGNRLDPFRNRLAFHSGVDYPAPRGTAIVASGGGRVVYAGHRVEYGKTVEIDHGGGLVTRYAHASKVLVTPGQIVMPGQKIAEVGSTGRSTGSHLHFEVIKDGLVVDPAAYLARF
ncbi:M23 family metallopeptidase [Aromatoleum evansii]|uniref:M23 family metallopeptidase n=1 Tax=Aromatoleum evansii TaxID=59406 RepID=A0ABZ1AEV5_AROEV|nr:M23 family metallopeptidase [Aromatoleum evansii]